MYNNQDVSRSIAPLSAESETMPLASGTVIINADDWGRDINTTDRSLECTLHGSISSVSGMVFMEDSERAASLARLHGIDVGLHLNLTTPLLASLCTLGLAERQAKLIRFLRSNRLAMAVYHPGLASCFEYVVHAQLEEFERLYGVPASRVDGHHHMHLCANVIAQQLIPDGTIVRRNFSFWPGEKSLANRMYRRWQDRTLARRHRLADYLFSLPQLKTRVQLERVIALAGHSSVEIETHPVNCDEYDILADKNTLFPVGRLMVARGYNLGSRKGVPNAEAIV
jgi:predicted glycoside hydrolase/deacetylase ChbG (UPF0249 family)